MVGRLHRLQDDAADSVRQEAALQPVMAPRIFSGSGSMSSGDG
jgi:hypothetical protein